MNRTSQRGGLPRLARHDDLHRCVAGWIDPRHVRVAQLTAGPGLSGGRAPVRGRMAPGGAWRDVPQARLGVRELGHAHLRADRAPDGAAARRAPTSGPERAHAGEGAGAQRQQRARGCAGVDDGGAAGRDGRYGAGGLRYDEDTSRDRRTLGCSDAEVSLPAPGGGGCRQRRAAPPRRRAARRSLVPASDWR